MFMKTEIDDNDDLDLDDLDKALLERKWHDELKLALGKVATAISNKDDKAVVEAIKGQGEKMTALVEVIKNLPQPETPIVNVEVNQEKVISSVNQICKDIIDSNDKVINALENRLLPDSFTLVKPYGGITESVKVNYKPANLIAIKK